MKEYKKANAVIKRAIELNPDNNDLHALLADSYLNCNYLDSALTEYSTFIKGYENKPLILMEYEYVLANMINLYNKTKELERKKLELDREELTLKLKLLKLSNGKSSNERKKLQREEPRKNYGLHIS